MTIVVILVVLGYLIFRDSKGNKRDTAPVRRAPAQTQKVYTDLRTSWR